MCVSPSNLSRTPPNLVLCRVSARGRTSISFRYFIFLIFFLRVFVCLGVVPNAFGTETGAFVANYFFHYFPLLFFSISFISNNSFFIFFFASFLSTEKSILICSLCSRSSFNFFLAPSIVNP